MNQLEARFDQRSEEPQINQQISLLALLDERGSKAEKPAELKKPTEAEKTEKVEKSAFSVSRDVSAPPDEVWKAIGKFDALPWHPAIQSGKVENKDGTTTRTLVAQGGNPVFVEQLLEQGPNFIRYKMTNGLPLQPEGTLKVESNGMGGSKVSWSAKIEGKDPKTVEAVTKGVTGFYEAGLDNLQKQLGKK
ncbi:MAG: SRPBCC family protein [Candidatus Obscuribacterales bacterium]|nr:SRPBCC family protein [Candidatus Obscuribacterales bacterium]